MLDYGPAPRFRMRPPSRRLAADTHDCIVVAILSGRPNIQVRATCAVTASSPSISVRYLHGDAKYDRP
jgi:hypothetical protein